ncbi:MAG: hypothetical protein WBH01_02205 [Dehalococcoidia bacterium]
MRKRRAEWRELTSAEKRKYAMAVRRLNLGIWGYAISSLRAVHLTTREGNDNTPWVFARDLRKLVNSFRRDGYDLEYNGALEFSPEKHLLHWHGIFRIKGGFFLRPMISGEDKAAVRRELGDRWNKYHGAFAVQITEVASKRDLEKYILKHILKEYIGVDEDMRNKFLFSRKWMREGWKKVEDLAKLWVLGGPESDGGLSAMYMTKEGWDKVNEIVQAWAQKETGMFRGAGVNGGLSGYLYMELGRIREAFGSGFEIRRDGEVCRSKFEYVDF